MNPLAFLKRILRIANNDDEIAVAKEIGVRIGDDCRIYDNARAVFNTEPYLITLGDHVLIASGARFLPHEGAIWCLRGMDEEFKDKDSFAPIIVGNNVIIGMNSIILTGVNIGDNVIVGAHSVVTKNVPCNSVVAGIPARVICSVEEFREKLKKSNKVVVPTKYMSADEKKEYLMKHYPEWFK